MLMKSIQDNFGEQIEGLGVTNIRIVYSKVGGVSNYDYMKLMGKPATLTQAVDVFKGMHFHMACLTFENGEKLKIDGNLNVVVASSSSFQKPATPTTAKISNQ